MNPKTLCDIIIIVHLFFILHLFCDVANKIAKYNNYPQDELVFIFCYISEGNLIWSQVEKYKETKIHKSVVIL